MLGPDEGLNDGTAPVSYSSFPQSTETSEGVVESALQMRYVRVASPISVLVVATLLGASGCGQGDMSRAQGAEAADAEAAASEPAAEEAASAEATAAADPDAPSVMIVEPADGAELDGPSVRVAMTVDNIELAPAGDERPGTGHHHLFLNVPITPAGEPIPADVPGITHLGKAQTEHELADLEPGEYTLIAVLGDLVHRRLDPQRTDTVRFTVRAP